jgi:tetratricopeptide (TPR) repeat protein
MLRNLKNNKSDSFVIKSLYSYDHAFSAVVRKIDNDYSFTVVNKGGRMPHRKQFEEFIIKPERLDNMLKELNQRNQKVSIEDIYLTIQAGASKRIPLNISSKNQKVGNCYIKEPENAIKFAYTTRKFSKENLEALRSNAPNKVFKPKWGVETGGVHRLFVEQIRRENPQIESQLNNELNAYYKNKRYRSLLKEGEPNLKSFEMGFNVYRTHDNLKNEEKYKRLLEDVNLDSMSQLPAQISEVVRSVKSNELESAFRKAVQLSFPMERATYTRNGGTFQKLQDTLKDTKKHFPWLEKEIKLEMHLQYFIEAAPYYMNQNWEAAKNTYQKANELYPNNSRVNLLIGISNSALGEISEKSFEMSESTKKYYKEALTNFTESIRLQPEFGAAYYFRAMIHVKLGDLRKAEEDMNKAVKLGFEPFPDEENMRKSFKKLANTEGKKVVFDVIKQINPEMYRQLRNYEYEQNKTKAPINKGNYSTRNSHNRQVGREPMMSR